MNSVRTTHSLSAEEHTSVDRSLLEYLKPKAEERYSRIEAYCDLLARASNSPYTAQCAGQQIDLLPGQCVLTISDLARKWQWQRATVRQFLDGLVALGLLEMKPFVKSYVFTIRQHSSLAVMMMSMSRTVGEYCCSGEYQQTGCQGFCCVFHDRTPYSLGFVIIRFSNDSDNITQE